VAEREPARRVRDRVHRIVADRLGPVTVDRSGDLVIDHAGMRVYVSVSVNDAAVGGSTIVHVYAVTNWDMPSEPDLFRYVATRSGEFAFGALSAAVRDDGNCNVTVRHALLGDTLDPDELVNALATVAAMALRVRDEVNTRFASAQQAAS
jgi:hypothetical protein